MSKNETGYWIKTKGNAKSQLTEPENVVRGQLKELGYGYRIQEKITVDVAIPDEIQSYGVGQQSVFTIDLFIPEHRICVEVDGEYHRTARQERKTAWRDAQLIANGYRVLHIDAAYTETQFGIALLKPLMMKALDELKAGAVQTRRIVA